MDIKSIRNKHGYTQEKLADLLDVSVDTVRKWEQGHSNPGKRSEKDIRKMFNNDIKEDNQ